MKHIFIKKNIIIFNKLWKIYFFIFRYISFNDFSSEQVKVLESYHNILSYACLGSVAGTVGFLVVDNM